jgi:hypothetical protein
MLDGTDEKKALHLNSSPGGGWRPGFRNRGSSCEAHLSHLNFSAAKHNEILPIRIHFVK